MLRTIGDRLAAYLLCRPVGLAAQEVEQLVGYVISRLGQQYDLKNLLGLARHLLPAPQCPCTGGAA